MITGIVYLLQGFDLRSTRRRECPDRSALGLKTLFPGFVEPALATASGENGSTRSSSTRIQVHIANEAVKVFTRRGHDSDRFKKIAADAWRLNVRSAIIDGEVIVHGADGTSDFSVIKSRSGRNATSTATICARLNLPSAKNY
jgi:bifunctional non-homologous end joining protein LigD